MSLKVGQYCKIKNDLIINKKYGTVTYNNHTHTNYLGKLLKIKITSNNTACCYLCEDSGNITNEIVGTFSESMLDFPKFEVGQKLLLLKDNKNKIINITKLGVAYHCFPPTNEYDFMYWYKELGENKNIPICENTLLSKTEVVTPYKFSYDTINVNYNENRLQEQETNISGRDRFAGHRVQGRTNKATISSRPLRNSKSIRGK